MKTEANCQRGFAADGGVAPDPELLDQPALLRRLAGAGQPRQLVGAGRKIVAELGDRIRRLEQVLAEPAARQRGDLRAEGRLVLQDRRAQQPAEQDDGIEVVEREGHRPLDQPGEALGVLGP